jgi:hypothetical protein
MSRFNSAAVALVVALAFAAAPLASDQCAAACESAHAGRTPAAAPACHHAAPAGARIDGPSRNCGHDHRGSLATLTAATAPASLPASAAVAVVAALALGDGQSACIQHPLSVSPPPAALPAARSRSLRI